MFVRNKKIREAVIINIGTETTVCIDRWKNFHILGNILKLKLAIISVNRRRYPPSGHNYIPIPIIFDIDDDRSNLPIMNSSTGFEMIDTFRS